MVPKRVLAGWLQYFRDQSYTAYAISAKYMTGVYSLIDRLRQVSNKEDISILIVGYPNTGKSSLLQSLTRNEKKVGISPNAGFTRVIQKVKLTNHIYLIDTPGVIPIEETDQKEIAIKACMTADKVDDPIGVVEAIFQLLPKKKFEDLYGITLEESDTTEELIQKVGIAYGRLRSGGKGEINEEEVAKLIIRDWQNNKLKYFLLPPGWSDDTNISDAALSAEENELLTHAGVETPMDEIGPPKKHAGGSHSAGKKGAYRTGR